MNKSIKRALAERSQALVDYIADVPDAYRRFQYWTDEVERLRFADREGA